MNTLDSNELLRRRARFAAPMTTLALLALSVGGCDSGAREDGLVVPQLRTANGDVLVLARPGSIANRNSELGTLSDVSLQRQVHFSDGSTCSPLGELTPLPPVGEETDLAARASGTTPPALAALVANLNNGALFSIVVDWWTESENQVVALDSSVYELEKLDPPTGTSNDEPEVVVYVGPPGDTAGEPRPDETVEGVSMLPIENSPVDPCEESVTDGRPFLIDLDGDNFPNLVELNGGVPIAGVVMATGAEYPTVPSSEYDEADAIVVVGTDIAISEEGLPQAWGRLAPLVLTLGSAATPSSELPLAIVADSTGTVVEVTVPRASLGDLSNFDVRFENDKPALVVTVSGVESCTSQLDSPDGSSGSDMRNGWLGLSSDRDAEVLVRCAIELSTANRPNLSTVAVKLTVPAEGPDSAPTEWTLGSPEEPLEVLFVDPLVLPPPGGS